MTNTSRNLRHAVRITLATFATTATAPLAFAQTAPATPAAQAPVQEIIVTGSRIQTPNEVSISPVTSITALDVEQTGLTRTEDMLNNLPQIIASQNSSLSISADGTATTWIWDCTAGKFNWFYDIDETVYLIEGSVIIKDHAGGVSHVKAGESIFFPAGSSAEWTVPQYVRKFAVLRAPLPRQVQFAKRVYHSLKRLAGRGNGGDKDAVPKMFG